MKYICQHDYDHIPYPTKYALEDEKEVARGKSTTVKTSGCGLCSSIMVAHRLLPNCQFGLEDALRISYETKANAYVGTTYPRYAPAFAQFLGLKYEPTDDPQQLLHCLRTGGAAVAHCGGDRDGYIGTFSHRGHYVAVINEEPDGRIAVLDPSCKEGKYEEEGRIGKVELKNGVVALCDLQVLIDDTASRKPCFHLFWRG